MYLIDTANAKTFRNLRIYPLLNRHHKAPATAPKSYLSLDEAFEAGLLEVLEKGDVNELLVTNRSNDLDVFIQSGEILKGGRQDRTIGFDFIVPSRSENVAIPSFCIESGRWHKRGSEDVSKFYSPKSTLSSKDTIIAARTAKHQGAVWNSVHATINKISLAVGESVESAESATSYQLGMEHPKVSASIGEYISAFKEWTFPAGTVGMAVVINGKLELADAYHDPVLFGKLREKLLQIAASEAFVASRRAEGGGCGAPGTVQEPDEASLITRIEDLAQAQAVADDNLPPRVRIRSRSSNAGHYYETHDSTVAEPAATIHRSWIFK